MIRINKHYLKLKASYLFANIALWVTAFQEVNPERKLICLGMDNVAEPLPQAAVDAFYQGLVEGAGFGS